MAAYAALTSLMHILEQIQNHPLPPVSLEKEQMECLCENVNSLQEFLEGYSHEGLEGQIVDTAYAAEDIIESSIVDQILGGSTGEKSTKISCQGLQKAIEDIDLIKKEAMKIKQKSGIKDEQPRNSMDAGISSLPSTGKNTMVGFDDVLIEIIDRLTGQQSNLQIMPIVGMGGIGKTTLARNAYNNRSVVEYFDLRVWVTISQEYSVREILLEALICEIKAESNENLARFTNRMSNASEHELGHCLYKSLFGRRYLIILDDMWTIEAWEKLKMFFPDNDNGSQIVITTRLSNVADHFSSCGVGMNFLDEESSWNLFCKEVFADEDCPLELEEIGKKIAKSCKGLPLSIVVTGGLLAKSKKTREYWEYVTKNLNSIINEEGDEYCLKILSLSYNHLPVHLKPCFLYMGFFPEDAEIRVSRLVRLWVAEGFLKPVKGKSSEEVAEEYLKDLVDRNLMLVHKLRSCGKIKTCNMHDLLRDLCLRECCKEKFLCVISTHGLDIPQDIHTQRRIGIHNHEKKYKVHCQPQVFDALQSASLVRTLICNLEGRLSSLPLRLLRVLSMVDTYVNETVNGKWGRNALDEIFKLVNSRYLDYDFGSNTWSRFKFPSSICLVWNLQTLIVDNKFGDFSLPPEIWKMPQLRHVKFYRISYTDPPSDDFILRDLQTLSRIKDFRCSDEVVKKIPNIKKLNISYQDFSGASSDQGGSQYYSLNNLVRLQKLQSLLCMFEYGKGPKRNDLLQSLSFPPLLKKLTLYYTRLHWEDMTIIGSLPHLQVLKLGCEPFIGPEWNPVVGEFPSLKFLLIQGCEDLVYWNADNTHFPHLEHLVLIALTRLKEIPLEMGEIPTLQRIDLKLCSDSAVISAQKIKEEQESYGNDGLQLSVEMGEIPTLQRIDLKLCSDSAVISAQKIKEEQESYGNDGLQLSVEKFKAADRIKGCHIL